MRWPFVAQLAILLTGCCGYHEGYYVHRQAAAVQQPASPMSAQPINLGQGVKGSDGSYGWRSRAANVDEAYNHAVALAEMHGCMMHSRDGEARADCGSARILVRRDRDHLYRLCVGETDRGQCAQTWANISR
jgi:hypothetical protein